MCTITYASKHSQNYPTKRGDKGFCSRIGSCCGTIEYLYKHASMNESLGPAIVIPESLARALRGWFGLVRFGSIKLTVSIDLLFDVFLMVFLAAVKIRGHLDGHVVSDGTAFLAGLLGQQFLLLGVHKDRRPVLGPPPFGVGRGVDPKEILQDLLVRPLVFVIGHPHGLRVVLDVSVRGVLIRRGVRVAGGASRVPDDRFKDALFAIEIALRTPKSSHGRLEGRVDVFGRRQQRTNRFGFGFLGRYHVVAAAVLHAAVLETSSRNAVVVVVDGRHTLVGNAGIEFGSRHKRDGMKGLATRNPHRCSQQSGG